jgi:sugar lactone lactonase YvrE
MRIRLCLAALAAAAALFVASAHGAPVVAIFTLAGGDEQGFKGDGRTATNARLDGPAGILALPDGAVVVADTINQRIRRIDVNNRIATIAGTGKRDFSGDGGPAKRAAFQDPTALALGKDGSIFVADTGNSRVRVIHPDGTAATLAGTADQGFSGDGGPSVAAQVNAPAGVAVDPTGRLFFSDTGNNRVRVINLDGRIATVAGTGKTGGAGDSGPASAAQLNTPMGLAFAGDGSLLIADAGNNKIRRIAPTGVITTVAGSGGGGSGGDAGPATSAQLNLPVDVAAVPQGGFFITEQGGNRVRHVDATGNITRLTGTGAPRYGGDGHPAATAYLNAPRAVELLPSNFELLIADSDNNRIRYVSIPGQSARLAFAVLKPVVNAPLFKKAIIVKKKKRRILVVRDVPLTFRTTKQATISFRLATKKGKPVTSFKTHAGPGAGAVHLAKRLRSGKHRLKKDHYVVSVTATAGSASAVDSFELVVK